MSNTLLSTTWHHDLLYKSSKLEFEVNLVKIIVSFLSARKLKFRLKANYLRQEEWRLGCLKVPSLPLLYIAYIRKNDASAILGLHVALLACDACGAGLRRD
jgi:hypothetical protein